MDIARAYTYLLEAVPNTTRVYSLWVFSDGSGWIGTSADVNSKLVALRDTASHVYEPSKYVAMLWPLFLVYVESQKSAWGVADYYMLALSKTGMVQIWDSTENVGDEARLLHEWPNLRAACSALETWKNGVML